MIHNVLARRFVARRALFLSMRMHAVLVAVLLVAFWASSYARVFVRVLVTPLLFYAILLAGLVLVLLGPPCAYMPC